MLGVCWQQARQATLASVHVSTQSVSDIKVLSCGLVVMRNQYSGRRHIEWTPTMLLQSILRQQACGTVLAAQN